MRKIACFRLNITDIEVIWHLANFCFRIENSMFFLYQNRSVFAFVLKFISQYDIVYWYGEWTAICRHGNTDTPFPFCGARESVPHF